MCNDIRLHAIRSCTPPPPPPDSPFSLRSASAHALSSHPLFTLPLLFFLALLILSPYFLHNPPFFSSYPVLFEDFLRDFYGLPCCDLVVFTVVLKSGLDSLLRHKGQYTLFAPTNEAFEKLSPNLRENVLHGKNCITGGNSSPQYPVTLSLGTDFAV